MQLIIDDRAIASPPVSDLVGARRFGEVIYRRKRIAEWLRDASLAAGCTRATVADSRTALDALLDHAVASCSPTLVIPSSLWLREVELAKQLFERLSLGRVDAEIIVGARRAVYSASGVTLPRLIDAAPDELPPDLPRPDVTGIFVDVNDYRQCLDLLSGAFEARHFNDIRAEALTVVKRSSNIGKIRAEHDYWHLLPHAMRRWFVMPYDLEIGPDYAQYRMERLQIADVALQWVHGAISPSELDGVLTLLGAFLDERPRRPISTEAAQLSRHKLYVEKVSERINALEQMPLGAQLNLWLKAGSRYDGLRTMVEHYLSLYKRIAGRDDEAFAYECIGHGDLCFSNMLYERHGRVLKLIDTKGAVEESQLWTDPSYDIAKLSHSIFGDYDYINHDLVRIEVDPGARLSMTVLADNDGLQDCKTRFLGWLLARGLDPLRVRLHEASLFISMLPLHVDRPHKVMAFLVNAIDILNDLEHNEQLGLRNRR